MNSKLIAVTFATAAIFVAALISPATARNTPQCEDGLLEIDGSNGTFTFNGYCEQVIIAGEYNRVVLGNVGKLEIAGENHNVTAGNIKNLDLSGSKNMVKLGDISSAEIAGSNQDLRAGVMGGIDVAGNDNSIKADRIGSATVAGGDNLIEYRKLNPNAKNPNKPKHPARNVQGSGNLVRWNKAAF